MRFRIVRTLIEKEIRRHLANKGGLVMAALLLGMALLLSAFDRSAGVTASAGLMPGAYHCYFDYWEESPWIEFLKAKVPESIRSRTHFRNVSAAGFRAHDVVVYPMATGAIQIRPPEWPGAPVKIWCWYPGDDRSVMAPFENWFWRTSRAYFRQQAPEAGLPPMENDDTWVWRESHERFLEQIAALRGRLPEHERMAPEIPALTFERSQLGGKSVDTRTTIATALVLFALFFICVYLLPSLSCEERERGTLLAQALSPASALEIMAAKLLFYPVLAVAYAGLLGAIAAPGVALSLFFWMTLVVLAFGALGIGLTICCVARTQRAASMGALGYMLAVSMVLLICQQNSIWWLPQIALEYHGPRLMHSAITQSLEWFHPYQLLWTACLATAWNLAAWISFRRFGWQ
jgi:ABC-2 family transporter protein